MALALTLTVLLVPYNAFVVLAPFRTVRAVVANVAVGAAVVAVARAQGVSWAGVGLDPGQVPAGLAWGAAIAAGIAGALSLVRAVPRGRALLAADRRLHHMDASELRTRTLLRIPVATALFEELAFRGALLGLWAAAASPVTAIAGSSIGFGLWHIGPGIDLARANGIRGRRAAAMVVALVVATAAGGAMLAGVRLASGGILAPFLAHWSANALGTVAAFTVRRSG